MKAIDAVKNLRALADLLEKHPEVPLRMVSAHVWFEEKEAFLQIAREFPRPYRKDYDEDSRFPDLMLTHGDLKTTGSISMEIPRSQLCRIVVPARPAVYECPSIFTPEEEAELEQA